MSGRKNLSCDFRINCVCMNCDTQYPKVLKLIRCQVCNQKLRWNPRSSTARRKSEKKRVA